MQPKQNITTIAIMSSMQSKRPAHSHTAAFTQCSPLTDNGKNDAASSPLLHLLKLSFFSNLVNFRKFLTITFFSWPPRYSAIQSPSKNQPQNTFLPRRQEQTNSTVLFKEMLWYDNCWPQTMIATRENLWKIQRYLYSIHWVLICS